VSQVERPRVTFHAPESVGECEGMNPALRNELPFWDLESRWIPKSLKNECRGHLKRKLWPKQRLGVKLTIWLPTTKSQESPWFPFVQMVWNILLESFWWGLQFSLRPYFNHRSAHKFMGPQSRGNPNFGNFKTPKMTFGW
jgi:hypothetical protein